MRYLIFLTAFCLQLLPQNLVFGQSNLGHSPISRFGLGQSAGIGLSRNEGMAGCGMAAPNSDQPNISNPALLSFNRKVNLDFDIRYLFRNQKGPGSGDFQSGSGGPAQLSFIIPISTRLSSGFGIRPFSSRDFVFFDKRQVNVDTIGTRTRGLGGISQVWVSSGYELNRFLSLGIEASYLFGTLEDSVSFGVLPKSSNYSFISIYRRKVSQFIFKPGLHFRLPVNKERKSFLALGLTADLGNRVKFKKYRTFAIQGTGDQRDTLDSGTKESLERPIIYTAGISFFDFEKGSLSFEIDWIKAPNANEENTIVTPKDAFGFRLGGEYTIGTKKSTRYLNIITFRGGLSYGQLPLQQDGKFLTDRKLSLGASFPIIRKEAKFSRPLINIGLAYGIRGLENSNVGVDKYWQVTLGFTLNDFLWFNRYRVD